MLAIILQFCSRRRKNILDVKHLKGTRRIVTLDNH
jgi:hypothetical protein